MAFSALLTTKSGRKTRRDGFGTRAAADEWADHEKKNCPAVALIRVMEMSEMSEKDKREHRKPGDPGYTGAEGEGSPGAKKHAEKTSEDFMDGHVHEITELDPSGSGETGEAGAPPHTHKIQGGIVLPTVGGEGDAKYISYHPGEVMEGGEGDGSEEGGSEGNKGGEAEGASPQDPAAEMKKLAEEAVRKFKGEIMKLAELQGVEIFATGTHRGKTFTEKDLDQIIANFAELKDKLKPPMVLGHDEDQKVIQNSGLPSLGWVTSLSKKSDGGGVKLVADFKEVPEVARKVIQQGKYKRFSSEIYENFTDEDGKEYGMALRRASLLGADIPEVKTLADVVALDETTASLLYCDHSSGGSMNATKTDPAVLEKIKQLEEENKSMAATLAKQEHDKHVASIASFCEALKQKGKFLPRWDDMGVRKFMENLDSQKTLKFGEGDEKSTPLAFFQALLSDMPTLVKLEEEAISDVRGVAVEKGGRVDGVKGVALDRAAREHMVAEDKAGRKLSYGEAVAEVSRTRPELFEE